MHKHFIYLTEENSRFETYINPTHIYSIHIEEDEGGRVKVLFYMVNDDPEITGPYAKPFPSRKEAKEFLFHNSLISSPPSQEN